MGTDIGSVQAAYQGFAKQNYTMLDNLKLGYGGTKTEMERLLSDAEKLSGVKYDINNLGDVYDAIHVIQGELGLTGVAASEAETTLTGSFGALKASWTNLLASMTTGEGLEAAMANIGKSAGNFLKNVVRMAGNVLNQLPTLISGIFNTIGPGIMPVATGIIQYLLTGISTGLPQLLTGGMNMILTLVQGLVTALPQLVTIATTFIPTVITGIIGALPQLLSTAGQIITTLMQGIVTSLPQLLSGGLEALMQFITGVLQNLPQLLETGITLIGELAAGAISAIPTFLMMIPDLFKQAVDAFKAVDWASIGSDIINGVINGIKNAGSALFQSLKDLASSALESAKSALKIGSPSRLFADEVGQWIPAGIAVGIEANAEDLNRQIANMINLASMDLKLAQPAVAAGPNSGGIVINQKIESVPQTPVQLAAATAAYFEQARWTL